MEVARPEQSEEPRVLVETRSAPRRALRSVLYAGANARWQEALALGLTLGAALAAISVVVAGPATKGDSLVVLRGLAFALAIAGLLFMRREMYGRLADSRRHWFASSPRGLAEMDGNLAIIQGNARLASLFATDEAGLVGTVITRYLPPEEAAAVAVQFKTLLAGTASTVESDTLAVRTDGSRVWVHWRATAVRKAGGAFDYFVITFEDTTAKHAAEQAALATLAELEKLNHLKTEFTSMVSHEFRTALTGIQGMSELIHAGDMEAAEVKEYSGYIFQEAERVNRLITDMLDLDRLEAGKMTMRMVPVDLNATIEDVAERTRAVCTSHAIRTDLDPNLPSVVGDSDRLVQVMTNLVSNAIKYSPDGGEVLITTRLGEATARISVRDHGVGIPADFVDHLFGRFERSENTPAKVIGTGLGLAITRQIIEMHGGRIWAERADGGGSVFQVVIPVRDAGTPTRRGTKGPVTDRSQVAA